MSNMMYRWHVLRCMYEFEFSKLTVDIIKEYLEKKSTVSHGLYEEWVVKTEEEFEEYINNPPNHDRLITILEKEALE